MSKLEINEMIFARYGKASKVDSVDPSSYHYIITEGQNSELMYFDALMNSNLLNLNSIRIVPLQKTGNIASTSDPYSLKEFAIQYREQKICNKEIEKDDRFFVMFDRDSFKSWPNPKSNYLSFLNSLDCADVSFLVCSPSFEFWLLLHSDNVYKKSREKTYFDKMLANKIDKRTQMTFAHKKCIEMLKFDPKKEMNYAIVKTINEAIDQSKLFETDSRQFADTLGTNLGIYFEPFLD